MANNGNPAIRGVSVLKNLTIKTEVKDISEGTLPSEYKLQQNYPNPFNPATTIRFAAPRSGIVTLEIFNLLGEKVKMLVQGQVSAGVKGVTWDGTDERGVAVASGIYFYRFQTKNFTETKRRVFLK